MDLPPDKCRSFNDGYVLNDGDNAAFSMLPEDDLMTRLTIDDMFDNFTCSCTYAPPSGTCLGKEPAEDYDFNDAALKYINQILMEEEIEEKSIVCHEASALEAAEKSFYEVIGERYPPAADQHPSPNRTKEILCGSSADATNWVESGPNCGSQERPVLPKVSRSISPSIGQPSDRVYVSISTTGHAESPGSTVALPELIGSKSSMQCNGNGDEATELLAFGNGIPVDAERGEFSVNEPTEKATCLVTYLESDESLSSDLGGYRGKKNSLREDVDIVDIEGRMNKHPSVYTESTVRSEMFDIVLLNRRGSEAALCEALRNLMQNGQRKEPNEGKARGKKKGRRKRRVVDLRTFLTLCAQAINMGDRGSADELLKQIREHASPTGDGMQRMAHYFANGLEARLAGSGSQIYKALMARPTSVVDVLKAYQLFLAACPFKKLSDSFSNKTIMNLTGKAPVLHIIDFGILYGFQWPGLIECLSLSPGGPPKLRITGVDLPQPGFKPEEIVEITGRRLASYAKTFNVPFKFNAIAKNWDTIKVEELNIQSDEIVVVNCYKFHNILDETEMAESPRDVVLNLIRKINPNVFILGVVNAGYGVPFFTTRFREALFYFSAYFDMLEATLPCDAPERLLLERDVFGRKAMNAIACEGSERIERPETYKISHVRNLRAGFRQLPLDKDMVSLAKDRLKSYYHKDFEIEQDGQWLLQGWKGRIVYALSTWRPDC